MHAVRADVTAVGQPIGESVPTGRFRDPRGRPIVGESWIEGARSRLIASTDQGAHRSLDLGDTPSHLQQCRARGMSLENGWT